jgi:hypothetical protein
MALITEDCENLKLDLAADVLRSYGTLRLRALGTSMLPSIWPGDVLSIENQSYEQIVPGDLVLVMRDRRFFVHRLIEKSDGETCSGWITRGDSLPQNDPAAATAELLGRVCSIRRGRRVIIPGRRVSLLARALAWMLRHWHPVRYVALRMQSIWENRRNRVRASIFYKRVGHPFSGLSNAACVFDVGEENQPNASN